MLPVTGRHVTYIHTYTHTRKNTGSGRHARQCSYITHIHTYIHTCAYLRQVSVRSTQSCAAVLVHQATFFWVSTYMHTNINACFSSVYTYTYKHKYMFWKCTFSDIFLHTYIHTYMYIPEARERLISRLVCDSFLLLNTHSPFLCMYVLCVWV